MIEFIELNSEVPYKIIKDRYDDALSANQKNIEAVYISSYSPLSNEVNARIVNLKKIINKDFIFFSNYNSQKAQDFKDHDQITAVIFWNNINLQIRLKAIVKRTSQDFNNQYFSKRSLDKNALALSSDQSKEIESYEAVKRNYENCLKHENLTECPDYWGGYAFTPYYFEFWEGHKSRLNKRDIYVTKDKKWEHLILQP